MIKITRLLNLSAFGKNKNNNKVIKFNIDSNIIEFTKKLRKLEDSKIFKSKKLSKSENLAKINIKKPELSFLILDAKIVFNYLWLIFIKIPIF